MVLVELFVWLFLIFVFHLSSHSSGSFSPAFAVPFLNLVIACGEEGWQKDRVNFISLLQCEYIADCLQTFHFYK